MPLTPDRELSRQVIGDGGVLAAPNLAWHVAIGQSTTVTHTVVANLFYRGVVFRRALNVAKVHHDATAGAAGRLVYGGHRIGIALHQAVRTLPGIVTVVGWHGCDHVGPVHEGDTLTSTIEVERTGQSVRGGTVAHLQSRFAVLLA
jgi:hypothetical protein